MRLCFVKISIFFALCLAPVIASAEEIPSHLTIVGPPLPPYIILNDDGHVSGVVVDITRKALEAQGFKVNFRITNWPRAYEEASTGKADAIIPTMYSAERAELFHYPDTPVVIMRSVLVAAKDSGVIYDGTIASLIDYKLARIAKARVAPAFDEALAQGVLNVDSRSSAELLILGVINHRLDAAAMPELVALNAAANRGVIDHIKIVSPALQEVQSFIAFPKTRMSEDMVKSVSDILRGYYQDGTYDAVKSSYIK